MRVKKAEIIAANVAINNQYLKRIRELDERLEAARRTQDYQVSQVTALSKRCREAEIENLKLIGANEAMKELFVSWIRNKN